jgi:hypothetical protein
MQAFIDYCYSFIYEDEYTSPLAQMLEAARDNLKRVDPPKIAVPDWTTQKHPLVEEIERFDIKRLKHVDPPMVYPPIWTRHDSFSRQIRTGQMNKNPMKRVWSQVVYKGDYTC